MSIMNGPELRNLIQYTFSEMLSLNRHDPKSFRVGFLAGYVVSKIDTQQYSTEQLVKIHDKVSEIISEFIFKKDDPEFDIDELLESLHAELAEQVDVVDNSLGNPSNEEVTDEELDKVLQEIEEDYNKQVKAIEEERQHIEKNAERYKNIYHQVCDFITAKFDGILMEIDRLEENQWMADDSTPIRIGELRREVIRGGEEKLKELLNGDEEEMRMFQTWLRTYDGGDGHTPGDAWLKDV